MIVKKISLIVSVIMCANIALCAQEIVSERSFERKGLYGFMNGGSDLYFEYGFKKLVVKEILFDNHKYSFEVYKMGSSKDAYGIYSIHIFKPLRVDSIVIGGFDCLSQYELQSAIGDEYISIVFPDGENAAKGAELLLKDYLARKETVSVDFIPDIVLKSTISLSGKLKYVRGELGLASINEEAIEQFEEIGEKYGLWIYLQPDGTFSYYKDPLD